MTKTCSGFKSACITASYDTSGKVKLCSFSNTTQMARAKPTACAAVIGFGNRSSVGTVMNSMAM